MSIKTISVIMNDPETCKGVFDTAAAIAAEHGAHVIGLHGEVVDPPPVMSPMDLPDASVMAALYDAASEKSQTLSASFEELARLAGVSYEWRTIKGSSGAANEAIVASVRVSDLVVSSQPRAGQVGEFDSVLFEGGRPILFVPWITREFKTFKRVLIAWDGSRGCARAVFDALPLLAKATDIEILSVDPRESDGGPELSGAEIAASLARHGLKVTTRSVSSEGLAVSSVLENRSSDFAADLLIMGAYGTSRLIERIFGGTSQMLLESMTVPVLMSR